MGLELLQGKTGSVAQPLPTSSESVCGMGQTQLTPGWAEAGGGWLGAPRPASSWRCKSAQLCELGQMLPFHICKNNSPHRGVVRNDTTDAYEIHGTMLDSHVLANSIKLVLFFIMEGER